MSTQYGIFDGVDYEEYDRIPALRFSALKHFERSPHSYQYHLANPVEPAVTLLVCKAGQSNSDPVIDKLRHAYRHLHVELAELDRDIMGTIQAGI
jgi:hypothetical protein